MKAKKLTAQEINSKLQLLKEEWYLKDKKTKLELIKTYDNFADTIRYLEKVARAAEMENHHPDLRVFDYNKLQITLTTHSAQGLTEKDFFMAVRFEEHLSPKLIHK